MINVDATVLGQPSGATCAAAYAGPGTATPKTTSAAASAMIECTRLGYLFSAAVMQAQLGRRVRGALVWPGAGVPLALVIAVLDLAPVATTGLLAAVLIAGVVTGFLLHRSGEVRAAKV
jgi:hypothetical protein